MLLRAGNGQLLAISEKAYKSDWEAKEAVQKVLTQIRGSKVKGVFIYRQDKSRRLRFTKWRDDIDIRNDIRLYSLFWFCGLGTISYASIFRNLLQNVHVIVIYLHKWILAWNL